MVGAGEEPDPSGSPEPGSIKGDVKRKHLCLCAGRERFSDIQPLGCGCPVIFAERSRWYEGCQEFLLIGLGDVVQPVRFSSNAVAKVPTMVLSETRGLRLYWVIRGGIR